MQLSKEENIYVVDESGVSHLVVDYNGTIYTKTTFDGSGGGVSSIYDDLSDVITSIGSGVTLIRFLKGSYLLDQDVTIPSNITLVMEAGSKFVGSAGTETLTINGGLEAGQHQIFDNLVVEGTIVVDYIVPQWFGAVGDGTTDDLSAINKALALLKSASGGVLKVPYTGSGYAVDGSITIDGSNITMIIDDDITQISSTPCHTIKVAGTVSAKLANIKILGGSNRPTIDGNADVLDSGYSYAVGTLHDGVNVEYTEYVEIKNLYVTNCLTNCINTTFCRFILVENCHVHDSYYENGVTVNYNYRQPGAIDVTDIQTLTNAVVRDCFAEKISDYGFTSLVAPNVSFINCKVEGEVSGGAVVKGGAGFSVEMYADESNDYRDLPSMARFYNCYATNVGYGFNLQGNDTYMDEACGAYNMIGIADDPASTIKKGYGVYCFSRENLTIQGTFENCDRAAIKYLAQGNDANFCIDNLVIKNAHITGCGLGIHMQGIKDVRIHDVKIENIVVDGAPLADSSTDYYQYGYGINVYQIGVAYNEDSGVVKLDNIDIDTIDGSGIYIKGVANLHCNNLNASSPVVSNLGPFTWGAVVSQIGFADLKNSNILVGTSSYVVTGYYVASSVTTSRLNGLYSDTTIPINDSSTNKISEFDYFKPEWWGAVGDGSTDDTTSIQNAINSVPANGILKFDSKTYIITSLYLKSNITLLGASKENTILKRDTSFTTDTLDDYTRTASMLYTYNADDSSTFENITIENMTIDGNRQNLTVTNTSKIETISCHNLMFKLCDNVNIKNVITKNSLQSGVQTNGSSNITIDNCQASYCGRVDGAMAKNGITLNGQWYNDVTLANVYEDKSNFKVTNCYIDNNTDEGVMFAYARNIQINNNEICDNEDRAIEGDTSFVGGDYFNVFITDNYIHDNTRSAITFGNSPTVQNLIIKGNNIVDHGDFGIYVSCTDQTTTENNIIITENIIDGVGQRAGVDTNTTSTMLINGGNINISNNICKNLQLKALSCEKAINLKILGNTFELTEDTFLSALALSISNNSVIVESIMVENNSIKHYTDVGVNLNNTETVYLFNVSNNYFENMKEVVKVNGTVDKMVLNSNYAIDNKGSVTFGNFFNSTSATIDYLEYFNNIGVNPLYQVISDKTTISNLVLGGNNKTETYRYNGRTSAPSPGGYVKGEIYYNTNPTELGSASSKYIILGWILDSAGAFQEMRVLTGN